MAEDPGRTDRECRLRLDHVGVIVEDLDAGAARWRRLGFTLSARSPQMGLEPGRERFVPWATANHCAVLRHGYLELIGVHRPGLPNPWARFLARFEGPHIAALRCRSADETYPRIAARCPDFDPPVQRRRDAPYGDGTREMRFRNIFSRDEHVPEARYIVIEHQTPEVLWQPSLMEHANGALRLEAIMLCAGADDAALERRLRALAGGRPDSAVGSRVRLRDGGTLERIDADELGRRFPGTRVPPGPALVGCRVSVADVGRTRAHLEAEGVQLRDSAAGVWVHPDAANGCIIEFVPHERERGTEVT